MNSTKQEYWDACLIKTWRQNRRVYDALDMFKSIVGESAVECEPRLRRVPPGGFPWTVPMRVFVAERLPKISDRLWSQPAENDVALLRKLTDSNYDTAKTALTDHKLQNVRAKTRRDDRRGAFLKSALGYDGRNRDTDWNVVKASKRHTR